MTKQLHNTGGGKKGEGTRPASVKTRRVRAASGSASDSVAGGRMVRGDGERTGRSCRTGPRGSAAAVLRSGVVQRPRRRPKKDQPPTADERDEKPWHVPDASTTLSREPVLRARRCPGCANEEAVVGSSPQDFGLFGDDFICDLLRQRQNALQPITKARRHLVKLVLFLQELNRQTLPLPPICQYRARTSNVTLATPTTAFAIGFN